MPSHFYAHNSFALDNRIKTFIVIQEMKTENQKNMRSDRHEILSIS